MLVRFLNPPYEVGCSKKPSRGVVLLAGESDWVFAISVWPEMPSHGMTIRPWLKQNKLASLEAMLV